MASIELKDVTVDLPIYGAHNMNLKGRVANLLARRETEVEVIRALNDVTLSIGDGDRIGIIGPNGSGKTTLLRVIAGILRPSHGEVSIQGALVSMIDQGLGMDAQCTGLENIFRRGIFLNQSTQQMRDRVEDIIDLSGLGDRIRHPVYTYSAGMKARLSFSINISIRPEILVIDEGFSMADSDFHSKAQKRMESLVSDTKILLLATHSENLLNQLCNKRLKLNKGKT
jgi:ABC-type polysaccharide/polyol phosphate transport system ATPase subunit